jgi:hypothetical protein
MAAGISNKGISGETGTTSTQAYVAAGCINAESDGPAAKPERTETEDEAVACGAAVVGHTSEGKQSNPRGCITVYLFRPEISVFSTSTVQGINDHYGVTLEVELEDNFCEPQVERVVPVYNKTDVLGLQSFLRDKFVVCVNIGSCVE